MEHYAHATTAARRAPDSCEASAAADARSRLVERLAAYDRSRDFLVLNKVRAPRRVPAPRACARRRGAHGRGPSSAPLVKPWVLRHRRPPAGPPPPAAAA